MKTLFLSLILWAVPVSLITLGTLEVSAECKNPKWDKRDTRSAESFLEYREAIKKWKEQSKRPSKPIPFEVSITSSGGGLSGGSFPIAPDQDYAIKLGMGFSEGLGAIVINGKFGFIDSDGKVVIEPKFTSATCFSEGLSAVEIDEKWGFLNKQGQIAIPLKFDFALSFSEGLALVKVGKRWGYIDKSGKFAIEPKYEDARSFSEGVANVMTYDKGHVWMSNVERKGRWRSAFIDKSGTIAIGPFDGASYDFTGGMALVDRQIGYRDGVVTESFFVDKKGDVLWILPSAYRTWFSEDVMVIQVGKDPVTNRGKYSILDRNGKRLTEKSFDHISAFSEGLAIADDGDYSGFIDKSGEFVLKPVYWSADSFSEGLASIYEKEKGKLGFIDKTGNWQIEPQFGWTGYFQEGKVAVGIGSKFGYIDKTGKYIWKPTK